LDILLGGFGHGFLGYSQKDSQSVSLNVFKFKVSNLIIALGLVIAYQGLSGIYSDFQKPNIDPLEAALVESSGPALLLPDPELSYPAEETPLEPLSNPGPDLPGGTSATPDTPPTPTVATGQRTTPTPQSTAVPEAPARLVIPTINLDAPVVQAESRVVQVGGSNYLQWLVPNQRAAGWHADSARLGEVGNLVLNGHHNIYGEVFVNLVKLELGDVIWVYGDEDFYQYEVVEKQIFPEKFQQLDVRMENAQWIMPTQGERLTLITCWPYESNSHRLVIVGKPRILLEDPIIDLK
jgi:LPXTG-site transpeptidase (sortase) family protein